METINITDLKNYDPLLIHEYLESLEGPRLEIIINKEYGKREGSIAYHTFYTYADAAYAAHLLCFASKSFAYYTPCPSLIEPFRFVVDLRDTPPLVKELYYLSAAYCYPGGEVHKDFEDKAHKYYLDAFVGNKNSYVWGLLYMASEAIMKFNEEEEAKDNEENKPE